ncbi:hypothetical protein M2155_008202 [Streptomyces sp. SAI-119]|uniref:hypothetical protein n=1 Tax=Streptomyces sp. SAI-119 TaxID=2940541 RepID=UPI00247537B2|nr:hypothetical protein [Streptomyces sp. SAI-119]MDH6455703.1 hypothetical protein [Streptomyces sp. SAI-119]
MRTYGGTARVRAQWAAVRAARAVRSRYGVGEGSGKTSASVAISSTSPVVVPSSRSSSEPGSYGGNDGRMYSSWSPGATPAGRGPPTAEKASAKPTASIPATALQVRTER